MSEITINSFVIDTYRKGGSTATVRIYADESFLTSQEEWIVHSRPKTKEFYKSVSCTVSGSNLTVAQFILDSTTNALTGNNPTYTACIYDENGRFVEYLFRNYQVPHNLSPASPIDYSDLVQYNEDAPAHQPGVTYTQAEVNNLFNTIPQLDDSEIWDEIRQTKYLQSYASLSAAITSIGSVTPTELRVTQQCAISANTTIPANIHITFGGNGSFTVASGYTLTISSAGRMGVKKYFYGDGSTVFAKNATGGEFRLEWWTGISDGTSNYSAAIAQVITSMTTSTGSVCKVGPGVWKLDSVTIPSGCFIEGAGRTTNITSGTVFKPYSTSAIDVFTFATGALYAGLRNCTVTTDGTVSTSSRAVVLPTNATTSFGVQLQNVHLHATLASSTVFELNDGGSNFEAVALSMRDVLVTVPVTGIGIKTESINTSLKADNLVFSTARGGTDFYVSALGWLEIDGLDARGPGSAVGTFADRDAGESITATISNGGTSLTLAGGIFTENDIGQKIVSSGQTFYITGLTSTTVATVTPAASPAITAQDAVIYRYTPDTTTLASTVFNVVGDHNTFEVNGFADEGFQYFGIFNASTNVSPMVFNAMTIQSLIDIKAACVLAFNGCALRSQLFTDDAGITGSLFFNQCSWDKTSIFNTGTTVELTTATPWGVHDGDSKIYTDTSFHEGIQQQHFETRVNFIDRRDGAATPIAGFGSSSNSDQPAVRIGRWNNYTKDFDHYYDINRDAAVDGYLDFAGNQAFPNRGYRFNANVCAVTFRGTILTPTQIAANQNDYVPSDSSLLIRLSSDASRNITGMAFTDTQKAGEMHILYNVGSFNITLVNQSGLSAAAYRFQNDTDTDHLLRPFEAAFCIYDSTTSRWRVSKWNISGVSSNGTTLTVGLIIAGTSADFSSNLSVNGTTTLENALTVKATAAINDVATFSDAVRCTSPTAGMGYYTGAGGTVTQGTSRTTGVTLNKVCGAITLFSAAGSATPASFVVTNSTVAATDTVIVNQKSGTDVYIVSVSAVSAGSFRITSYTTGGTTVEQPVFNFSVIKAVTS